MARPGAEGEGGHDRGRDGDDAGDGGGDGRIGARWWRESLVASRLSRRHVVGSLTLLGGAALGLPGCVDWDEVMLHDQATVAPPRDVDVSVDALELQRVEGWDVGQPGQPLPFVDSSVTDIAGSQDWRGQMEPLATLLAPTQDRLAPYYVPTLFQSLIGGAGQRLRAVMRPMASAALDDDFARGLGVRSLFAAVEWPRDTAVVVDAPGPRALAVAAALADRFEPIFAFGNWPHPLGVVPAQQTLAATLYYLPLYQRARALRPADAPPVFVLDGNRLAPYGDADRQFDNRYLVTLPDAAQLGALGIRHLLYVSDLRQERDDLNAAFVALYQRGIDIQLVALDDFARATPEAEAEAEPDPEPEPTTVAPLAGWDNLWWWWSPLLSFRLAHRCWWLGSPWLHDGFWGSGGVAWYTPRRFVVVGPPREHRAAGPPRYTPTPRTVVVGPPRAGRAVTAGAPGPGWLRTASQRPPGFGQVTVRTSLADHQVTGVRAGHSGSFSSAHVGAPTIGRGFGSAGLGGHAGGTLHGGSLGRGGGFSS